LKPNNGLNKTLSSQSDIAHSVSTVHIVIFWFSISLLFWVQNIESYCLKINQ